jgi:histidyl-tRNA synthetase
MMIEAVHGESALPREGVQAIALGSQARAALLPLVMELRRLLAAPVLMDFEDRKLLAHLKSADRNNARFALILGSDELAAGEIVLRDVETREDRRLPLGNAADLAAALGEAR